MKKVSKLFLILFIAASSMYSQSEEKQKMNDLSFMVGDWVGISKSFSKKGTKTVTAHEEISYSLDKHIITIDLKSESLQLHTIIYYDSKEMTYYYCPYSKRGMGKYAGKFEEGKFIVHFNPTNRLIFKRTAKGEFQEYGEQLKDGVWTKYFEDTFPLIP